MIVLTLGGDGEGAEQEDLFINPAKIIAFLVNEDGETDVVCVDQTVFVVKESPLTIYNLINKQIN